MTTNLLSVIEQLTKAAIYFKEVDPSVRSHCTWNGTTESEAAAAIEAGTQALEQTQVEPSAHPSYATERERLEALSRICEEGHAVEKIIKDAVKRNPNAFLFKEQP